MKKTLLLLFLFASMTGFSQKALQKGRKKLIINDTIVERMQHLKDSMILAQKEQKEQKDSGAIIKDFNPNFDYLVQLQKDQKAKQKRAAMIRIGIGGTMMILLIIGLMRRKKKK